jgi:polynucleotide 5'-kinase involved in rRNA processing
LSTTLIIGPPGTGKTQIAREFASERGAWFLNLDPAEQEPGPLCAVLLTDPNGSPRGVSFIGSLRPTADPIATLRAASWAAASAGDDPLVVEFPLSRLSPPAVHLARELISILSPVEVISVGLSEAAFLHARSVATLEPRGQGSHVPSAAVAASRKSAWARYFQDASTVKVPLATTPIAGARLGSGIRLETAELDLVRSAGFPAAVYAEACGSSLLVLGEGTANPGAFSAAADLLGCDECRLVAPAAYAGLVAALESASGTVLAVARLQSIDFVQGVIELTASAESAASVGRLRLGRHCLTSAYDAAGELKPWQV